MPEGLTQESAAPFFKDCDQCPEMAVIPPGSFVMGFDGGEEGRYEGPVRTINIAKPFALGRFEITVSQYSEFVEDAGYEPAEACAVWDGVRGYLSPEANWQDPNIGKSPDPSDPVVCVNWHDTKAFVEWLAQRTSQPYRLPTEAEWEYVASEGTRTKFPWGNNPKDGCSVANMYDLSAVEMGVGRPVDPAACRDGYAYTASPGSLNKNKYGVFDILGNVWEWLEDCYAMPYPDKPTDGTAHQTNGDCERRAVRGGSWTSDSERHRVTFRGRDPEHVASQVFGFRVARDLP